VLATPDIPAVLAQLEPPAVTTAAAAVPRQEQVPTELLLPMQPARLHQLAVVTAVAEDRVHQVLAQMAQLQVGRAVELIEVAVRQRMLLVLVQTARYESLIMYLSIVPQPASIVVRARPTLLMVAVSVV
jgi:hypothetical protein